MIEQTVTEREGYTRFFFKGTGDGCTIAASCYPQMLSEWMNGRAFFTGVDCYGDVMTVRLADVVAICLCTPEGMERWQADEDIRKSREMLTGGA